METAFAHGTVTVTVTVTVTLTDLVGYCVKHGQMGVPVGWRGTVGPLLAVDPVPHSPKSDRKWFSVHAEDYLARGYHTDGLSGKLKAFLESQNVSPEDYPYAYLITAPRFCGFSFNPVSFWYLYGQDKRLRAMILEVNNTFDERRMYFLPRQRNGDGRPSSRFGCQWEKDFHVSPFNDREGSYSLSAIDPFEQEAANNIDNTVVLSSLEGKPKVVARVFSVRPSLEASRMSALGTVSFIARWWWVGFMTNPRILREARKLWAKKIQVFYRPEVLTSSIGRSEAPEETLLEPFFRAFLQRLADSSGMRIDYSPAAGKDRGNTTLLPGEDRHSPDPETTTIDVKVMTPAFYAELAREPGLLKVLDRFCFRPGPGQAMLSISDPTAFRNSLKKLNLSALSRGLSKTANLLSHLRRDTPLGLLITKPSLVYKSTLAPAGSPTTTTTTTATTTTQNAEDDTPSLDIFVRTTFPPREIAIYEQSCLRVLLADRLAWGFPTLLNLYVQVMWLVALLMLGVCFDGLLVHGTSKVDFFGILGLLARVGAVYGLGRLWRSR